MRETVLSRLRGVGPAANHPLKLEVFSRDGDHVIEGVLHGAGSQWYPVLGGVPCFLRGELKPDFSAFAAKHNLQIHDEDKGRSTASDQAKTTETFSDKWRRFKNYGLEPKHEEFLFGWYCKKFGVPDIEALKAIYRDCEMTLEVGPGSGFNSKFIASVTKGHHVALDVSEAANTTYGNTKELANCTVVQADLMDAPFDDGTFDLIVADGVLHHTPSTRDSVRALYAKLKPGGRFFFYVYRRMGAARYFVDQHIRDAFMPLTPDQCYEACEGITELGRELSRLGAKITLEKPIPALGIPAGTHDVQRLLYYNFVKCFWNEAFDYETNNMVNFDWYHPHNAWQHSTEEVEGWLKELGAVDYQFNDANPNGISAFVTKPKA
jgi:SAM-dependent methyltransferase/uncharacterized protein YbaR (Trm112 family)